MFDISNRIQPKAQAKAAQARKARDTQEIKRFQEFMARLKASPTGLTPELARQFPEFAAHKS